MGWLFLNECPTRSDLVAHLRRPGRFGDKVELARACVVKLCDWTYTLNQPAGARRGWKVTRQDGEQFRLKAAQLARAEVLPC